MNYMPHGACLRWEWDLIYLHIVSDFAIFAAYTWISGWLGWLIYKRLTVFRWISTLFCIFIFACGLTHLMDTHTMFSGNYWLEAWVKVICATASLPTAIAVTLAIPWLQRISDRLEKERDSKQ